MDYSTSCKYSIRLIEKLKLLDTGNKLDFELINKAIYFAKKYHDGQMRKSGEPFYTHPLEVAYMISDYNLKTDIIVTSILHDTIEDTSLTFEMIREVFGEQVAGQVVDLTRIKECGNKISSAEIIETLWLQKKYDQLLIKLFDRLHNVLTIHTHSPEKQKKVITETLLEFLPIAAHFSLFQVESIIGAACSDVLSKYCRPESELGFMPEEDFQPLSLVFRNVAAPTQNQD